MILTNIECIPGKTIVEHYGLVSGSTVRAKHIGRDIMAGLKNIFGGELKGYTELLTESREEAVARMVKQAEAIGLSVGSVSHALGTVSCMEADAKAGSYSSIALVLCGIISSILAPIIFKFIYLLVA